MRQRIDVEPARAGADEGWDDTGMAHGSFEIQVECYAGHRGEQEPRRLRLEDRVIEVVGLLDSWLAPDHRYFKVRGDDGAVYIVRHDAVSSRWELTMFQRA